MLIALIYGARARAPNNNDFLTACNIMLLVRSCFETVLSGFGDAFLRCGAMDYTIARKKPAANRSTLGLLRTVRRVSRLMRLFLSRGR